MVNLHTACTAGNVELVQDRLQQGADPTIYNDAGTFPLFDVLAQVPYTEQHARIAQILIQAMPDVNFGSKKTQTTALHTAAAFNRVQEIEALVRKRANVNAVNIDGTTPLIKCASFGGNVQAIVTLVRLGANVNAQDKPRGDTMVGGQLTALHYATQENQRENVLALLSLGADRTIRSTKGKLPNNMVMGYNREIGTLFNLSIEEIQRQFKAVQNRQEIETNDIPALNTVFANENPFRQGIETNDITAVERLLSHRRATEAQLTAGFRCALSHLCKIDRISSFLGLFIGHLNSAVIRGLVDFEIGEMNGFLMEEGASLELYQSLLDDTSPPFDTDSLRRGDRADQAIAWQNFQNAMRLKELQPRMEAEARANILMLKSGIAYKKRTIAELTTFLQNVNVA